MTRDSIIMVLLEMDPGMVKTAVSAITKNKYSPSHVATMRKTGQFLSANKSHAWHKSNTLRAAMKKVQVVR